MSLLGLPIDLLRGILCNIPDLSTLLAFALTCRRMYYIYVDNGQYLHTLTTLRTLDSRRIDLSIPCVFAEVVTKNDHPPSIYLQHAIQAIYHQDERLPLSYSRALRELVHFRGYRELDSGLCSPEGWKWELVTDEKGLLKSPVIWSDAVNRYVWRGPEYHLLFIGELSSSDIEIARGHLFRIDHTRLSYVPPTLC